MKQKVWLLCITFALHGRELVLVPYAYRGAQVYFLLSVTPHKTVETVRDTVTDEKYNLVENAAIIFSQQTNALWGKYSFGNQRMSKKYPTVLDFEKSNDIIGVRLEKAVGQGAYVSTASQDLYLFEVPYLEVKPMLLLESSQDAWYAHNTLMWISGSDLFEKKTVRVEGVTRQEFKVKKIQIHGLQIDEMTVRQLNLLGTYIKKQLNQVLHPPKGMLDKFVRHTTRGRSVSSRRPLQSYRASPHSARLRKLRK